MPLPRPLLCRYEIGRCALRWSKSWRGFPCARCSTMLERAAFGRHSEGIFLHMTRSVIIARMGDSGGDDMEHDPLLDFASVPRRDVLTIGWRAARQRGVRGPMRSAISRPSSRDSLAWRLSCPMVTASVGTFG